MCIKMSSSFFAIILIMLISLIVSVPATTESSTEANIDSTSSGSTSESATGSSMVFSEDTTIISLNTESTTSGSPEDVTTSVEISSEAEATAEPEPSVEPEPTAEPEPTTEPEPSVEPEPLLINVSKPKAKLNHSLTLNISSEMDPLKKLAESEKSQASEKSADKCACPVSDVLTTMVDVLKELNSEVQSMKAQMILKCPGFGNGNETEISGDKIADSLEAVNTTDAATEVEDVSEGPTTTSLPPIPTECDAPFQPVASSCYYFLYYPQDWKTWGEANAYCQTLGGTLAAPHRFADLQEYLINNFSNVFWVGAKQSVTGSSFEWLTGKIIKDEDWKEGQPSTAAKRLCVYVESFSGYKAVNYYCGEKFSFICEKRVTEDKTTEENTTVENTSVHN